MRRVNKTQKLKMQEGFIEKDDKGGRSSRTDFRAGEEGGRIHRHMGKTKGKGAITEISVPAKKSQQ